jgi:hypothetical protein
MGETVRRYIDHQAVRSSSTVTVAALAVPATAAAGGNAVTKGPANDSNPILQNDIRRFGTPSDIRHFGNPVVVRVEGGFDWTAAGVGAAGGVGLALVVGAGTFSLRRRQRVDAARA